jgi:anti-sigma B factor antagonist
MTFHTDTSTGKKLGVAELIGRLDAKNSSELITSFALWQQQTSLFVFDCTRLDFIDSSGLGTIVSCLRKAIEHNGDVKLANLSRKVSMVFEITKAKKLFSIFPDTGSALHSFESNVSE